MVPDFLSTTEQRGKAQPAHIKDATPLIESGDLTYFGVILSSHDGTNEDYRLRINGSAVVLNAESEQAIRDYLERDAYTRAGVWDVKKAQIWAFKSG